MTTEHVFRLPDIGEGLASAEVVQWFVAVGERVEEEQALVEVMTDKATVEMVSPVTGVITRHGGAPGATIAVGDALVVFAVEGDAAAVPATTTVSEESEPPAAAQVPMPAALMSPPTPVLQGDGHRPVAGPAVRRRALEAGIDLRLVPGSGPGGRITHDDLDRFAREPSTTARRRREDRTTEIGIVGLRRRIAERLTLSASRIPHFSYVDEVDVTELERLRSTLNKRRESSPKLTLLPFVVRALVGAVEHQPILNAHFDDERGVVEQHEAVHVGIATQTPQGLVVPVVHHAEALDLWECAAEIARLADAARRGAATRDELTGSTITISSLGSLGGLATTPVINHPEVAIVGINKMQQRPVWDGTAFVPRTMMNLSASFDHRVVDGVDAAMFVRRIAELLETPAVMFLEER